MSSEGGGGEETSGALEDAPDRSPEEVRDDRLSAPCVTVTFSVSVVAPSTMIRCRPMPVAWAQVWSAEAALNEPAPCLA